MHDSIKQDPLPPDGNSILDETDEVSAWEEIETGRYMPRRIRGSYRGGSLG